MRIRLAVHGAVCLALAVVLVGRVAGLWAAEPAAGKPADDAPAADKESADSPPAAEKEGEEQEPGSKFIRLTRDAEERTLTMDTAIVRYVPTDPERAGLVVDLIGAVHIGEKEYYAELNRAFQDYDALLYELVAPEGTRVSKGASGGSPVSMLQTGMKGMLELEFQLDEIDYHQDNFVHADMSPDDFAKSMRDRGESIWSMVFKMMGQSMAQQSKNPNRSLDAELLLALFDRDRALALKRVLAEQFEDLEGVMTAFDGPDGSTIITERNKKALEVLAQEIEAGKKRLAIFYGAGHLPDMESRLLADFGLKRAKERWIVAWDLRDKPAKKPANRPGKKKARSEG